MNLVSHLPSIELIRRPDQVERVQAWPRPAPPFPMPESHVILRGAKTAGVAVHGFPFTFVAMDPELMKVRDAVVVASVFENLNRSAGFRWACTFVADGCPYAGHMHSLGYREAPGKLYWKEI